MSKGKGMKIVAAQFIVNEDESVYLLFVIHEDLLMSSGKADEVWEMRTLSGGGGWRMPVMVG